MDVDEVTRLIRLRDEILTIMNGADPQGTADFDLRQARHVLSYAYRWVIS
jgi:hypothetical protein